MENNNDLTRIYALIKTGSPDNELIKKAKEIDISLQENLVSKLKIDRIYRIRVAKLSRNTFLV